ncbi:MAG: hypothetical protein K0R28_1207 [Paenibacillus sp.]|nr:hypothetical protein [Paenibacillus sp.]
MNTTKQVLVTGGKIVLAFLIAFMLTLIAMIPVMVVVAIAGIRLQDGGDLELTLEGLLNNPAFTYGSIIAQAAGFIAAVPIMYSLFERKSGWAIGWRGGGAFRDLFKGAGIGIVMMTAIFLIMLTIGALQIRGVRTDTGVWWDLTIYLLFFAVVSLNEELFSRGYVQGLIRHRFGPVAAILCSSLFFALLHTFNPGALQQPLPLFNIFAAGLLLGLCREVSGSLWLPIGLHWTWNYVQGNVFGYEVSGTSVASLLEIESSGFAVWSGGSFGAEGSLIATVVMGVGIWLLWRRRDRRTAESS